MPLADEPLGFKAEDFAHFEILIAVGFVLFALETVEVLFLFPQVCILNKGDARKGARGGSSAF